MALSEVGTIRRSGDDGRYAESWLKINNTLVQSVELLWSASSSVSRRQMYINYFIQMVFFARFFLFSGFLDQNLAVFDQCCPPPARSASPSLWSQHRGPGHSAGTVALVGLCRDCVTALVLGEGQARAAGAGKRAQAGRYGWGAGGRVPAQMARAMSLRAWHLSWVMARLRL